MDIYMPSVCQNYNQRDLRQESGEVFPKMLMNAQPRRVVHGHETFVQCGRAEPSHQGLSEMTDNQINLNTWNSQRLADPSPRSRDDSRWNAQKAAGFVQSENYQGLFIQNACTQLPLTNLSYDRAYNFDQGITSDSYPTPLSRQNCSMLFPRRPAPTTSLYQSDSMQADNIEKLDVVLCNPNYQWPWTIANPSSSYFAEDQGFLLPYNMLSDSLPESSYDLPDTSLVRSRVPSCSGNTSSSSLYSGYTTSDGIPDEQASQEQFGAAIQAENIEQQMIWNENHDNFQEQMGINNLLPGGYGDSHCGLQDFPADASWFPDPLPPPSWFHQSYAPSITISPKDLTLNTVTPFVPMRCPEILNTIRRSSTSTAKPKSLQDSPDVPRSPKKIRKRLPEGRLSQILPHVPMVLSSSITKVSKKRGKSPRAVSPILKPASAKDLDHQEPAKSLLSTCQAAVTPKKTSSKLATAVSLPDSKSDTSKSKSAVILPKLSDDEHKSCASEPVVEPEAIKAKVSVKKYPVTKTSSEPEPVISRLSKRSHRRQESKDRFLVASKLAGMSYKEIRIAGDFSEAESTLRGRFRTLTKEKEARVRRPAWQENDIRLLKRAVRKLTRRQGNRDLGPLKISWKLVAEYIANNGGSYHFGNATCRKKWDELQMEGEAES